jgi:hypothetical protein
MKKPFGTLNFQVPALAGPAGFDVLKGSGQLTFTLPAFALGILPRRQRVPIKISLRSPWPNGN